MENLTNPSFTNNTVLLESDLLEKKLVNATLTTI